MSSALGRCPDCGTELTPYRSRTRSVRPASWCWKCERVLRPGEARNARRDAEAAADIAAIFGPRVDPAFRRAVQRQQEERNPPQPPIACMPADLDATGDEGHLGLLTVLIDAGWAVSEQRKENGRVTIWATNGNGSYTHGECAQTEAEAALQLFKALYSDEPDAIACACGFWPPPERVAQIGAHE